jgi:lincosamide nucleotidyltransferase A/C/D/E
MRKDDVLATLRGLADAGVDCWVDGGWGVDALVGRQTRAHDDLDIVVDAAHLDVARRWLTDQGYAVARDWLPTAIAMRHADGTEIDLHPITRTPDGGGEQAQLDGVTTYRYRPPVTGRIDGEPVRCCPLADQLACHLGYEPRPKDRADMRALADAFGMPLPERYAG